MEQKCSLDRKTGERLCRRKLKQVSSSEDKLYQSVLLKNTLKFIETTDELTFCCHVDEDYEPLPKRQCFDENEDDIENILKEMIFLEPLLLPPEEEDYQIQSND